jgi:hypothetical protein
MLLNQEWSRGLGRAGLLFVSVVSTGAACSLINAFDDVITEPTGAGGAGTGGTTSTSSGTGGSGATGGGGAAGDRGIIAIAGKLTTDPLERRLVTIDAANGHELDRVNIHVVGAAHDGKRDRWYIFEAPAFPPSEGDGIRLYVGTIDPQNGRWEELGQTEQVPVLVDAATIVVLNDRLVYRAYNPNNPGDLGLAVLDTTDDADPKVVSSGGFLSVEDFFGAIGTRADGATEGGGINLIIRDCTAVVTCDVSRLRAAIPNDPATPPSLITQSLAATVPPAPNPGNISMSQTSQRKDSSLDVIAFPPVPGDTNLTIRRFNPSAGTQFGSDVLFPLAEDPGNQVVGVAMAECEEVALVTELKTKTLYAYPLAQGGTAFPQFLDTHTATAIFFEPTTRKALLPFRLPEFQLGAYALGGTPTEPTLTKLQAPEWEPPADVQVDIVVPRQPLPITTSSCSQ